MKDWRSERDKYPHVGQLADALDDLKYLALSGFSPPAGFKRVVGHLESAVSVIDDHYQDERVCALALESVQLVIKSVKSGFLEDSDEIKIARIASDLRNLVK